jgi:hypothetical protein
VLTESVSAADFLEIDPAAVDLISVSGGKHDLCVDLPVTMIVSDFKLD